MKQKDFVFLLTSTSILVLIWIALSIYHNLATSTIPQTLETSISPIDPTFDKKTLKMLKQRSKTVPVYTLGNESLSPTPIGSASAEIPLSEGEQATQGGELLP